MEGTYNAVLVLTSLLVAILAAYTALDMVDRVNKSPRRVAIFWLVGGGFAMGGGIWSMHFIGMLAYTLPIPLGYDPLITLLSLSAAIAASTFALWLASQSTLPTWRLLPGALLMGLGIATMHYLGMEAMRMRPAISYDPFWFIVSVLVAIAASWTALRVFFLLRSRQAWSMRLAASGLLGFAVVGMHYTGMAATRIPADAMCGALRSGSQLVPNDMAVVVTILTVAVLALVLLLSLMDRRMESRMLRMRNAMLSMSLEEANAELSQATLRDPLTRLANRHLLKSRLATALVDAQQTEAQLALLVIDIDGFQYINDAFGHQTGDALLVAVAERLRDLTRPTDTLARTGGDEFVLLTRLADSEDPGSLAARIVSSLAHGLELDGRHVQLTASVGVALTPVHSSNEQELMSYAIAAVQQAKQSGRNQWQVFSPWMSETSNEQIRLLGELRQAIGSEQICLYYQPKLRTRDNTMAGAEAQLRWLHPELGNIPGERVVRLAERGGLTLPLGNWVLEQACRQLQQWHQMGHTQWTVSVNLSPLQFHDAQLLGHVRDCLERYRIPARQLLLEITESTVMRDTRSSIALLNSLSALGVGISIDDFGTGYSSLLYLKQLPATELKIGSSFTEDLKPGSNEVTIVSAVIALGHGLDMDVVAEGIGNREQRMQLERMGCDFLQGVLIGMAVPPARFEQLHAPRRMAVKDVPAASPGTLTPPTPGASG